MDHPEGFIEPSAEPLLSLVMPCYNEEGCVRTTVRRLLSVFSVAGHEIEIVAVDNGSTDRTGEILRAVSQEDPRVRPCRVEVNQGYGHGVLTGIAHARGAWVGIIPADGQVDADDVVRLFDVALTTRSDTMVKVRRRFRMDGFARQLVSVAYNLLMQVLWPGLESLDVNGTPKIAPRRVIGAMQLRSEGWLLDPEIMIKARYMGVRVLELNVFARMRSNGVSHVRAETCWEFLKHLFYFRFSREMHGWRAQQAPGRKLMVQGAADSRVEEGTPLART